MRTLKSTDTDLPGGFSSNNYNLTWSVRLDLFADGKIVERAFKNITIPI